MNYEDRVTKEYVESAVGDGLRLITGTYIGDGAMTRFIDLGVTPKIVCLWRNGSVQYSESYFTGGIAFWNQASRCIELSGTGFYVGQDSSVRKGSNTSESIYYYIALY